MCLEDLTNIIECGEDGFWIATIPEILGAIAQGKTTTETWENVLDALIELMPARRELAMQALHRTRPLNASS
ncbi:MAG: HicB family protein [Armatimonadota bacterium]